MRIITILYSLLLIYIIAAILFWGFSLNKQSNTIYNIEKELLAKNIDSVKNKIEYQTAFENIKDEANLREHQYFGEGATFLAIILIGAGVVYSSIRSNHKLTQQQKNFILSITHELKSPIAAIKLNLQTLSKRILPEDKKQQLLDRSIKETDRLNDLCSNLLIASQVENNEFVPTNENINFSTLIEQAVNDAQIRYPKYQFLQTIQPNINFKGDKLLLQLLISNLLENAVKYSPFESSIHTSLQHSDDSINLSVADNGIGIPNDEKKKIFQKFYRVGNEDTRKTKGTGLGLFLIEKIIKKHNGLIEVRDNTPCGTIFDISF